jgi:hypothetical protein
MPRLLYLKTYHRITRSMETEKVGIGSSGFSEAIHDYLRYTGNSKIGLGKRAFVHIFFIKYDGAEAF